MAKRLIFVAVLWGCGEAMSIPAAVYAPAPLRLRGGVSVSPLLPAVSPLCVNPKPPEVSIYHQWQPQPLCVRVPVCSGPDAPLCAADARGVQTDIKWTPGDDKPHAPFSKVTCACIV